MTQLDLMHETFHDALIATVMALGGYKRVGSTMRPELPVEQAANWLRDCLNPGRREKLDPDQTLMLIRLGRQAGIHAAATFAMRDCGYSDPQPLEPEDERAALMREYIAATKVMAAIAARQERLSEQPAGLRRVG